MSSNVDFKLKDIEPQYNFVQKVRQDRLSLSNINVFNLPLLDNFINSCQKIIPSYFTKKRSTLRLKNQRRLSRTIKRARQLGVLRFKH